jgi:hypothetical protein
MLLKRPKRPAFGYRFALLTQIRDFLDSPLAGQEATWMWWLCCQILQAVIVHPDKRQVFPLSPEAIKNSDALPSAR